MTQGSKRFLQPEAIARISRLELHARTIVEGFLSGLHRSPYFGQSIEFVQHREYVPGDDFRRIDWKVWSKTDKYYLKLYEEDTNLRTLLVVDASESMLYGTGPVNKLDYAKTLAACLSYLLLKQQDAVGAVVFNDSIGMKVPMRTRRNHLHDILTAFEKVEPTAKTNLGNVLGEIAGSQSQRGLIVLISDLLADRDGLGKGLRMLRTRGHDVMILHVMDDSELDFEFSGTTRFDGLEDGGQITCDPRSLREGYLKAVERFLDEIRAHCSRTGIDYRTIRTSEHVDAVLAHFLSHRLGKQRAGRH